MAALGLMAEAQRSEKRVSKSTTTDEANTRDADSIGASSDKNSSPTVGDEESPNLTAPDNQAAGSLDVTTQESDRVGQDFSEGKTDQDDGDDPGKELAAGDSGSPDDASDVPRAVVAYNPLAGLPDAYDRGVRSPLATLGAGEDLGDERWWMSPTEEKEKPAPEPDRPVEETDFQKNPRPKEKHPQPAADSMTDFESAEAKSVPGGLFLFALLVVAAIVAYAVF